MNNYILILALFWVRTTEKNRVSAVAEPVMMGSFYVGRVLRSGKLVGGTVYRVDADLRFLGALDRRFYFSSSGAYEVVLDN